MNIEESYKIIVDWSKYEHEKMEHFNTVNIAIHTIIVTAIGYVVWNRNGWLLPYNLWVLPIFGFLLGLLWFKGLCDVRDEVDFRYEQLRSLEVNINNKEQKIFTKGYDYFKKKKTPCGFWGLLKIYKYYTILFLMAYAIIILINLSLLFCSYGQRKVTDLFLTQIHKEPNKSLQRMAGKGVAPLIG